VAGLLVSDGARPSVLRWLTAGFVGGLTAALLIVVLGSQGVIFDLNAGTDTTAYRFLFSLAVAVPAVVAWLLLVIVLAVVDRLPRWRGRLPLSHRAAMATGAIWQAIIALIVPAAWLWSTWGFVDWPRHGATLAQWALFFGLLPGLVAGAVAGWWLTMGLQRAAAAGG
jgi:hypothetical protein